MNRSSKKLLNAIKDIEECKYANFEPEKTVKGLISDFHASLAVERSSCPSSALDAHFVDRKLWAQRGRYTIVTPVKIIYDVFFVSIRAAGPSITRRRKGWQRSVSKCVHQFATSIDGGEHSNESAGDPNVDDVDEQIADDLEYFLVAKHIIDVKNYFKDDPRCFHPALSPPWRAEVMSRRMFWPLVMRSCAKKNPDVNNDGCFTIELFYGGIIDTGCARTSSGGLSQNRAYCWFVAELESVLETEKLFCKCVIRGKWLIGRSFISFPIKIIVIGVYAHILDEELPLFLSISDMK